MIALAIGKKKKEKQDDVHIDPVTSSITVQHTQTSVISFFLTYNRHCTERHNQWKRSKSVRGKHSQLSQHQQKQSTPPCLGFEVSSGVFGACQPDVAVFLENRIKVQKLWHAWCFLMQGAWGRINICFMIPTWRLSAILITRCPKIASNAPIKFSCKKVNTQILNLPTGPWREFGLFAQSGRENTLKSVPRSTVNKSLFIFSTWPKIIQVTSLWLRSKSMKLKWKITLPQLTLYMRDKLACMHSHFCGFLEGKVKLLNATTCSLLLPFKKSVF